MEQYLPNYAGDILGAFQQGQDRGKQSKLAQLLGTAVNDPAQRQSALGQAAMIDPGAAMSAKKSLNDESLTDLSREAGMFLSLPDEQKASVYPQLAQKAQAVFGHPLPTQFDPKYLPMIQKLAGVQAGEGYTLTPGSRRYGPNGELIAEAPLAPANAQMVAVPDGQGGTVQMMFDPKTRQLSEPQYPGQQAPADTLPGNAAQAGAMLDPTKDYPQLAANFPGTQVSSLFRTPAHNAEVGGVANSQHTRGTAGDFVVPKPEQAAFIAKAKAMGYEVIPEGDHVHVELPPGRKAAGTFAQGARLGYTPPKSAAPKPQVQTLSPDEVKQMGLPPGTVAQRDDSGRISVISRPPAAKPADDTKAQKIAAARADALDSVTQAITGIDTLTKSGGFQNLGTFKGDLLGKIPHTQTKDAENALETVKNQVLLTTLGKLKALSATGASGFGALSNSEGNILKNSIANIETAQSHEAIVHNLNVIRGTLQKAAGLIGGQAAPSAPAQGGHVDDLLSKYGVK